MHGLALLRLLDARLLGQVGTNLADGGLLLGRGRGLLASLDLLLVLIVAVLAVLADGNLGRASTPTGEDRLALVTGVGNHLSLRTPRWCACHACA